MEKSPDVPFFIFSISKYQTSRNCELFILPITLKVSTVAIIFCNVSIKYVSRQKVTGRRVLIID